MTDPYKVLGVRRDDIDEKIKYAYRELVKKYHPDNYVNTNLADVATEKMQEVNQAYDTIMNERKTHGNTSGDNSSEGYSNAASGNYSSYNAKYHSVYANVRSLLHSDRLVEAENLLNDIPVAERTAEWFFLKGSLFFARGWLEDASSQFSTAHKMDPNNSEYKAAYNRMMWQRQGNMGGSPYGNGGYSPYSNPRGGGGRGGCSGCDMCSGLLCADCCCECCGGDLISCC